MIILIADDDKLIRFTMKSMLSDILDSSTHYIEASNGTELITLCEKYTPDIAFVDIKMPYMDGITAIEKCMHLASTTSFIIISGYSDFEYAKRCISLNVIEYLLKPVDEEQLTHIISVVKAKLEQSHHDTNAKFQLQLLNAFNYFSTVGPEMDVDVLQPSSSTSYYVFGLFLTSSKSYKPTSLLFQKEIINATNAFAQTLLEHHCHYTLIYSTEGTPYFIFNAPHSLEPTLLNFMQSLCFKAYESPFNSYIIHFKAQDFYTLYNECEYWDKNYYLCMNTSHHRLLLGYTINFIDTEKKFLNIIHTLLSAYTNYDEISYKESLMALYALIKDSHLNLNLKCICRYISYLTNSQIQTSCYTTLYKFLSSLAGTIHHQIEITSPDIINDIKTVIQKDYMNDLSISQLADKFDLTPNYLSSLFHQRTNCKLIDYIIQVRISNAKRLLLHNPTASVKDIAVMVGYTSSRHFSTLFQKYTGVTPSSYRKEYLPCSIS